MHANARPEWQVTELMQDALWSHHLYHGHLSLSDNLYDAMGDTLARLAETDPVHAGHCCSVSKSDLITPSPQPLRSVPNVPVLP